MIFAEFAEYLVDATLTPLGTWEYVNGIWTEIPPEEPPEEEPDYGIKIIKPQPVRAEDLSMMPAGEYVHNYLKTWTSAAIGLWGFGEAPYELSYNSKDYKVVQVDSWNEYDNFRRVIIREKKENE